jgi:hypothetical protein
MSQMFSPDDPLFWLHHCNIDRLYHCWIDCQGYENVKGSALQPQHYSSWVRSLSYSVSSPITYSWDSAPSVQQETQVLPKPWPKPSDLWSVGLNGDGWDKINYRYGKDQIVRGYGKACPDQKWSIVDVGYVPTKKRDEALHERMWGPVDSFERKLSEGKTHVVALHEMAMEECESAPKTNFGPKWKEWMDMMGVKPEQFDTICDKPSQRMGMTEQGQENHVESLTANVVPLWVIIVASVGSALLLIAVVSIVIVYTMKKKAKAAESAGSYRQM